MECVRCRDLLFHHLCMYKYKHIIFLMCGGMCGEGHLGEFQESYVSVFPYIEKQGLLSED